MKPKISPVTKPQTNLTPDLVKTLIGTVVLMMMMPLVMQSVQNIATSQSSQPKESQDAFELRMLNSVSLEVIR